MPRTPDVPEVEAPTAVELDGKAALRAAYARVDRADVALLTVVADAKFVAAERIKAHFEGSTNYVDLILSLVTDENQKPELRLKAAMAAHQVIHGPQGSAPRPRDGDQQGNLIGQLMGLMAPNPGAITDSS